LTFAEATTEVIDRIEAEIAGRLSAAPTVEAAAHALAALLYDTFVESAVLARVFVTVPFVRLPASSQEFVRALVGERSTELLKPHTPVLSLVGTRGLHPRWNSRHSSRGHLGIPLVSMDFLESIPMIARLLKELGATLEWMEELDTAIVTSSMGRVAGAFFVEDAATGIDDRGRNVITAQDFVSEYGVRTVFGFGGAYPVAHAFLAAVVFTRETIERRQVQRFMRLANSFKAATMRAAREGRIFEASAAADQGSRAG
jgi:hypothetical protein